MTEQEKMCSRQVGGARNGYQAALLARGGAVGTPNAFDGSAGLLAAMGGKTDPAVMEAALFGRFRFMEIESKPIDGCLMIQTPAQLMECISRDYDVGIDDIERIVVTVSRQALNQAGCDSFSVENSVQAKMNIRYAVASVICNHGISGIRWKRPFDEQVTGLMRRIELVEEPAYTNRFPGKVSAGIYILLKDGRSIQHEQEDFQSLPVEQVKERFLRLTDLMDLKDTAKQILRELKME